MHPRRSAQEVLFCDLCETVPLQSHCELCNTSLCVHCVVKHMSDSSKRHNVVHFFQRKRISDYPKCPKHSEIHCELHCKKCKIPICSSCVSSGKHKGHDLSEILGKHSAKREDLVKDLEELENKIYPRYEKMASEVQVEKIGFESNYKKLTTAADQQGEALHRVITVIVNQRTSAIQKMKKKHQLTLNKDTEEITQKFTDLKHTIADLKGILKSNHVSLTSPYKSRNCEFRTMPSKVRVTLPIFSPGNINTDQLKEMFGSLSSLSIGTESDDRMKSSEDASSSPVRSLLDERQLTTAIDTGYDELYSVSCLSDDQVWTRGNNEMMKLLNLQGKLLTSIQTMSGNKPEDITVTRHGNRTVNLVKNKKIHTMITP